MTMGDACGNCQGGKSGFFDIGYADIIGILSFFVGLKNLTENQQQSEHSEQLIKQIDVDAANDRQAAVLLEQIGARLDAQDRMLKKILEVITDA